MSPSPPALPLLPLLYAYAARRPSLAELGRLPDLGPRFAAVLGASARWAFHSSSITAPSVSRSCKPVNTCSPITNIGTPVTPASS